MIEPHGSCSLSDCPSWDTPVEPTFAVSTGQDRGRQAVEGDAIKDVADWLRYDQAEFWWGAPAGDLQRLACSLIWLRANYEMGRWPS